MLLRHAENKRLNSCAPQRRWLASEADLRESRKTGAEIERREEDVFALGKRGVGLLQIGLSLVNLRTVALGQIDNCDERDLCRCMQGRASADSHQGGDAQPASGDGLESGVFHGQNFRSNAGL